MKYTKQCNGKFKQIKDRNDVIKELVREFYTEKDKSFCHPNTLAKNLVFQVHQHFDLLPNDWIYSNVHSMLLDASEGQLYDDVDSYIDIYTSDLIDWSKQFSSYIDDAMECGLSISLDQAIKMAQYYALSEIVAIINDFIDDQLE